MILSASIVIYNEKKETLQKVIDSFLSINLQKELIIVDNSPQDFLRDFCNSFDDTKYIYNDKNEGFAKAHNLAFKNLEKKSDIHIILNPDVYFSKNIKDMVLWMYKENEIALSVPKVFFPNGKYQHTIRKIPTITRLIKRKLKIKTDEFKESDFDDICEIDFAHGCFYLFKSDVYRKLSGFDERFFLYMEDVDIFLRAKKYAKTVINPNFEIYHEYRKGSSTNLRLFLYHLKSFMQFFLKYPKLIF